MNHRAWPAITIAALTLLPLSAATHQLDITVPSSVQGTLLGGVTGDITEDITSGAQYLFTTGSYQDSVGGSGCLAMDVDGVVQFHVTDAGGFVVDSTSATSGAGLIRFSDPGDGSGYYFTVWFNATATSSNVRIIESFGACSGAHNTQIGWSCDGGSLPPGEACTNGVAAWLDTVSGENYGFLQYANETVLAPPSAPTLTGSVIGTPKRSVLIWDTPDAGSFAIQGYNITKTDPWGTVSTIRLGLVNTYSDIPRTRNQSYTVHAWSAAGDGPESNLLTLRIAPIPFIGDDGALYGGDKDALAASIGTSTIALDMLYSIILVVFFAGLGYMTVKGAPMVGGIVGGIGGVFIATAFGMLPLWALFFLAVVGAAVGLLWRSRGSTT